MPVDLSKQFGSFKIFSVGNAQLQTIKVKGKKSCAACIHSNINKQYFEKVCATVCDKPIILTSFTILNEAKMSNKFDALKQHAESSDSGSGEDDLGSNITELGPVEYPPGEHRLEHAYCLWFSQRPNIPARSSQVQGSQGYSQALRLVGQIGTVEQWWGLYCHMIRLSDLPPHTDLHLFKKGIQPMWEDMANAKGGKWVIRLRKGLAGRAWENLCMAMLGEQFMVGNEICGVVVSIRYQEDLISIWNRTASDQATTARIRDALKRLLNLPANTTMEYKTHNDSLKSMLKTAFQSDLDLDIFPVGSPNPISV